MDEIWAPLEITQGSSKLDRRPTLAQKCKYFECRLDPGGSRERSTPPYGGSKHADPKGRRIRAKARPNFQGSFGGTQASGRAAGAASAGQAARQARWAARQARWADRRVCWEGAAAQRRHDNARNVANNWTAVRFGQRT